MKTKTKKIIYVIVSMLTILLILTGCGKSDDKKDSQKEEEQIDSEISLGEWNDDVYTNEFLDLSFTLPNGWTKVSDERLAELMNISTSIVGNDKEYIKKVIELTSVYYVSASDPSTGDNIIILSEKPLVDASISRYMEQLKNGLLEQTEINYVFNSTSTETIGSRTFNTLTMDVEEYNMIQKYYVYKQGDYFIGIIVTSTSGEENAIDEIIKAFDTLD